MFQINNDLTKVLENMILVERLTGTQIYNEGRVVVNSEWNFVLNYIGEDTSPTELFIPWIIDTSNIYLDGVFVKSKVLYIRLFLGKTPLFANIQRIHRRCTYEREDFLFREFHTATLYRIMLQEVDQQELLLLHTLNALKIIGE